MNKTIFGKHALVNILSSLFLGLLINMVLERLTAIQDLIKRETQSPRL